MQARQQPTYTLCVASNYFYLQCLTTSPLFSPILGSASKHIVNSSSNNYISISRRTSKVQPITSEQYQLKVEQLPLSHVVKFYHLLGTIIVNQQPYLLIATDIEKVGKYLQFPIYRINEVQFIAYRHKLHQSSEQLQQQLKLIEELKRSHLSDRMYFSYKQNITTALITQKIHPQQSSFNEFAWNKRLLEHLLASKVHNCWTIPIIQGFVAEITNGNQYFSYEYLTISRRSIHMSGTRFHSRGIDEQGHPSNFVQTEEIFKCHSQLYVHLSVRGSVPIFWKQRMVRAGINYQKDNSVDEQLIMKEHYKQLERRYGAEVTTINLLSKTKSPEKELKNRFQALFNRNLKLNYLFFDLNESISAKGQGQASVSNFVNQNIDVLFGKRPFSLFKHLTRQIDHFQSILPRINCLDCLDRTNVLMARISENYLKTVQQYIKKRIVLDPSFLAQVLKLWTQLGDCISQIYCGTISVAGHMTRKQNHSLRYAIGGALTSINRYINASLTDTFKQQAIDCLLGNRYEQSKTTYFQTNIVLDKIEQQKYCLISQAKIAVVTFSTNEINASSIGQQSWQNFIGFASKQSYDIIVFHFQQINCPGKWIQKLNDVMEPLHYNILIHHKTDKSQLLSIVYFHSVNSQLLTFKFIQSIQIPLKSYGGLALFLAINDSIICLINCKLQSGYGNRSLRVDDFNQLHAHLNRQTYHSHLFKLSQTVILAGNLNFRLSNNIQKQFKFKNMIQELYATSLIGGEGDIEYLIRQALQYDELNLLEKSPFYNYQQQKIYFFPTYKYNVKKGGYDKTRLPAWCDRIIFSQNGPTRRRSRQQTQNSYPIQCEQYYRRIQQHFGSSHKAVLAAMRVQVVQKDESLQQQLIEKYLYE